LLEDERRRLEAENVQLRAALAQRQSPAKGVGGVAQPQPEVPAAVVPDLAVEKAAPDLEVAEEKPSDVPVLEVSEEPSDVPRIEIDEVPHEVDEAVSEKKARILTPAQLTALRHKMKEKMAAHKKSA
jgi:hypothetical protein